MRKKVFSISFVICLIFMLASVASLATTDIEPAKLSSQDYIGEYKVETAGNGDVVNVKITADNVVEHKNAEGEYGYWVGFAVPAPEGGEKVVNKMTWTFGEDSATEVALEPNVTASGEDGVAFYVDASNPKTTATLQWLSDSEPVGNAVTYNIDVSNVAPKVSKAILASETYAKDYEVTSNFAGDNKVAVQITANDIVEHINAEGNVGYWIGFALEAPEDASGVWYKFNGKEKTTVLENNVTVDGKDGVAFYIDAYAPETTANVKWIYPSGVGKEIIYNIENVSELKLPEVKKAILSSDANVDKYEISSANEGKIVDVTISADSLVEHVNAEGNVGYWIGFALQAPEGAEKVTYTFGEAVKINAPLEINVTEEGKEGVAFYVDVANPKETAKVTWIYGNDDKEGKEITYNIDVSGVKIKLPEVKAAPLTLDEYAEQYTVKGIAKGTNEVDVEVTAKNVVEHINAEGNYGYWLGFALEAPENADGITYMFGDAAVENGALETNVDGEGNDGVAFYVNAASPKTTAKVKWVYDGKEGSEIIYNIILKDITLKMPEVKKAILKDENLATGYSVTSKAAGNVVDVTIAADNVTKHANAQAVDGYWIGFALEAPSGAKKVTYTFGGDPVEKVALEKDVAGVGKDGIAFYVNAAVPKPQAKVKWVYDGDIEGSEIIYNISVQLKQHTITFNMNDRGTAPEAQKRYCYELATKPTDPTYSGYTFGGWYKESGCTNAYDFNTPVTADIILYAKWTKNSSSSGGGGGGSSDSVPTYKITVTEGKNGSISPNGTVKVEKGDNQKFKIKPDKGYEIEDVIVDGESVGAVDSYTFKNVKKKHTIKATFQKIKEEPKEEVKDDKKEEPEEVKPVVQPTQTNKKYTDVKEDAWYATPIQYVTRNNLMNGVGNDKFNPSENGTRAMIVTILYNKEGQPKVTGSGSFKDVTKGSWYEGPIAWAKANNIANGYQDGSFGPSQEVTREQLAVMLYNYAKAKGKVSFGSGELNFTDKADIHTWAQEAMEWCVSNKIINGKGNNKLDPRGLATRAEIATMIMNFCEM